MSEKLHSSNSIYSLGILSLCKGYLILTTPYIVFSLFLFVTRRYILSVSTVMDAELTQSQIEAILGPDSLQFETLISNLWSSSEEKRSEAKSAFNTMKQKAPDLLVLKLVDLLGSSQVIDSRDMCVVLLRKLVTDDEGRIWRSLSVSTQSNVKCVFLSCIKLEESEFIIKKLCDTVATLAASLLPHNDWPELLPFLNELCVTSNTNRLSNEYFFLIFYRLAEDIAETLVPNIRISHSVFLNTLNDTLDLRVRIAVLTTAFRFIHCLPSLNERQQFQNLLPATLRMLTDAMSNGEDVLAQDMLSFFTKLAKNEPRFLRTQLADVMNTMFEIAEATSLKEPTRHMAITFVLKLLEGKEKALGMLLKLPRFTNTFLEILLNLLLDIKDEPHWHTAETNNENAGVTKGYYFGCSGLEQFSKALGGKTIAPVAIEQLSSYFVAPEWEKRHAALIALFYIVEGSSKVMINYLEQLVNMVLHSFQDPHPRVRWAAIRSIAWWSIEFFPDLQEQYHNQVLPALASAMDDFQNPRVQAHASVAVMKFCISKKPETLVPYLDGIPNKLLVLLQTDNQMVQEAALDALGYIADFSKEHFQKYYDFVMPHLKVLLVNANDKSNHMLRSKAMECISFVGIAVGKEKFRDDLHQAMEVLKSLQESRVKELDTIVYILQAWSRICQCVGKDFLPYMSTVMPFLVECAQLEPDKTVLTNGPYSSTQKVKLWDELICIKGSDLLYAKFVACSNLALYALSMKEDFYPWIPQAASIFVPLLKFYMHNNIRNNAARGLYVLLRSAKLAVEKGTAQGGESYFKQLSGNIILALADAIYSEPETKLCAYILRSLGNCLHICGPLLNEEQVCSIIGDIKHVITESSRRKGELTERAKSKDFDVEAAELLREEREQEDEVFENVGHILVTLIETFKAAFLPFFDELSSYLVPNEGKDKTAAERITCFFIFDKLVEYCGEEALKYFNIYLPFLLEASNDEIPLVRQNALYGLGLCAEYGGSVFKPFVGEALPRINVVIMHFRAREAENELAYDNAISTLGKILQFHQETIDSAQIIPAWLNSLPIKGDLDEAKFVHDQLCSMVERSDRELLGPNYEHFPKIISVFTEVLCAGKDLATKETTKRMINVLRNLQRTLPAVTWASAWSLLLPQQEMEMKSILSPKGDAN